MSAAARAHSLSQTLHCLRPASRGSDTCQGAPPLLVYTLRLQASNSLNKLCSSDQGRMKWDRQRWSGRKGQRPAHMCGSANHRAENLMRLPLTGSLPVPSRVSQNAMPLGAVASVQSAALAGRAPPAAASSPAGTRVLRNRKVQRDRAKLHARYARYAGKSAGRAKGGAGREQSAAVEGLICVCSPSCLAPCRAQRAAGTCAAG